jgi:metallo-beta-lactamase family protein
MQVTFFGATEQVTGSQYVLQTNSGTKLLIDSGLFQGGDDNWKANFEDFDFTPSEIDALVLTHAHLDHCGRIPKLVREGFNGKIIATKPTLELARLLLEDSVRIIEEHAREQGLPTLYDAQDVMDAVQLFSPTGYHQPMQIKDVTIELIDAGHILGSAIALIDADNKRVVFSGDLGNAPVPLLFPTEYVDAADMVIMESTYGARVHEDKQTRTTLLKNTIHEVVEQGGVLMIPAFALERTQELLYEMNQMVADKEIPHVPMYLDSPLAIKATAVFQQNKEYLNQETRQEMASDNIFQFPGLTLTEAAAESKSINNVKAPKIIIAGSGMAEGGRIVHHIERYIEGPQNHYLIIGYQVEGTLGRQLLDGAKTVKVNGKELQVRAKVSAIGGYSAHADRDKLTDWILHVDQQRLKKVCITHGELSQAQELQAHLRKAMSAEVIVPQAGQTIAVA